MEIKRDETGRCIGKFFHKSPGIKCSHTKEQAIKDMIVDCDDFYSQVYVYRESIILQACECEMIIYNINTNLL